MRALLARYLRRGRNRYAAYEAVRYLPACGQSIFARKVRAKEDFAYYMYREICERCSRDFCSFGANIDLLIVPSSTVAATTVPLPHKDCFAIGGRLVWLKKTANDGQPFPQKLLIFGLRAKVGVGAEPSFWKRLGQKKVLTHAVRLA